MMSDHDLVKLVGSLVGKPHRSGAYGPDYYDCWAIVKIIGNSGFDHGIEEIPCPPPSSDRRALAEFVKNHPERQHWRRIDKPVHGGLVEMSHSKIGHHLGIYLKFDGGRVLHSLEDAGVMWEPIKRLIPPLGPFHLLVFYERIK